MEQASANRFEQNSHRLVFFALWLQGCLTLLALSLVVAPILLAIKEFSHEMNVNLPSITETALTIQPLLNHPWLALVFLLAWTMTLMRLRRWRPHPVPESEVELPVARLEVAFALHIGLNCVALVLGFAAALPFIQLLGCL